MKTIKVIERQFLNYSVHIHNMLTVQYILSHHIL